MQIHGGGFAEAYDPDGDSVEELAVDFISNGLWEYDYSRVPKWIQINPNNPRFMVRADLDGDGDDELAADFGFGKGLWIYDEDAAKKWKQINPNTCNGPPV